MRIDLKVLKNLVMQYPTSPDNRGSDTCCDAGLDCALCLTDKYRSKNGQPTPTMYSVLHLSRICSGLPEWIKIRKDIFKIRIFIN
ncbi:hypothetical protein DESC_540022 [Desulfosarcina cetonica]|nr:hypothetical protein DESC_540022 [Desulfosarcina cetonica]